MSENKREPNRLINETSPYLLQHAYNPVDWYPWGSEALERAKREEKLILLSIGYSACHWCHVMERESFESESTAKLMNESYVCIKVDREERPDLDKIYQMAHQVLLKRGGGWPLTVFITPDEHVPIFVGTYFPDKPRHGMMSFSVILNRISEHYEKIKGDLAQHTQAMLETFEILNHVEAEGELPQMHLLLELAVRSLLSQYDPVHGGFGGAPKFPHSTQIDTLLVYAQREFENDLLQERSLSMAAHTLDAMANGGLRDHIGGGFYRYSVDDRWEIPHFEKMLYDNALLLPSYVDAGFCLPGNERFYEIAIQTANWMIREMQSPLGGYYSSLDADSEDEEGKFYVWTRQELVKSLTSNQFRIMEIRYGLRGSPNFEGHWHLRIANSLETVVERTGLGYEKVKHELEKALRTLFYIREKRIRPALDDKILASWNGLAIRAMARAGRLLNRPEFIESAEKALNFVRNHMWKDGRLLATAKDKRAHLNAYLDDYVFLADGVLELLSARWRDEDLQFAIDLVDAITENFESDFGGFTFTSADHEELLFRAVPRHDEAIPSGNGVVIQVLLKLANLIGNLHYEDHAEETIDMLHASASQQPSGFGSFLCSLEQYLYPPPTMIIRGENVDEISEWARKCAEVQPLQVVVFPIPNDAKNLPNTLAEKGYVSGAPRAYYCTARSCGPCYDDLDELIEEIKLELKLL